MNQLNWGTRDNVYVPQKRRKANLDENDVKELEKQLSEAKMNNELVNKIEEMLENGATNSNDELLLQILAALERLEMKETIDKQIEKGVDVEKIIECQYNQNDFLNNATYGAEICFSKKLERDDLINPFWIEEDVLKYSDSRLLEENECVFWKKFVKKYLQPDKLEPPQKHKLQLGLDDMRDRGVFAFFMLNALWIAFVFPVLLAQDRLKDMLYIPIPIPSLYYQPVLIEPLGVLHLAFFAFISLTQFIAMLCHRYNTFQHILASTKLRSNIHEGMRIEDIIDTVKMLQQIKPIDEEAEPMPDYSDEEIDKISDEASESEEVLIDGKPAKNKSKPLSDMDKIKPGIRNRFNDNRFKLGKFGQDNPAFIDDTSVHTSKQKKGSPRSKSEDQDQRSRFFENLQESKIHNRRNRRSRRLQKKNSLDVQFRKRFSMLRDANAQGYALDINVVDTNGINNVPSELKSSNYGPRMSFGNISAKNIIDKRFNKMLFNMHGIPVRPNVTNQQQQKNRQKKVDKPEQYQEKQIKNNRKRKNTAAEHHV